MANKAGDFLKSLQQSTVKYSPKILTGIGIAGMVIAAVSAVRVTPKALQLVDQREADEGKRLNKKEIVKTTWKCYIPSAVTGVVSIACIIGADTINTRRNTALAAAYALSLQDFADYKRKALEVVGEKKEEQIRDEVNKEKLIKDNVKDMPIIHTSGSGGKIPCYDPLSKRLFESDMETLRSAVNTLNTRIMDEMYITLNEYYAEIGLDPLSECIGESMGWDLEHGQIKPQFTSQLVNGIPYLVIGHNNPPHYMR